MDYPESCSDTEGERQVHGKPWTVYSGANFNPFVDIMR